MRFVLISSSALLVCLSSVASAQATHTPPKAAPSAAGDRALIANALSAAPASVAAGATVVGHDQRVLRKGTTDWVCMPDMPDVPNDTPMCLDAPWRSLIDAWMNKKQPSVKAVGFGYMLQGDMPVSNTDPFATAPSATNQWIPNGGPHVMMVLPDAAMLSGISTDPANGGPFVMWKGTPYAHVMIPTTKRPK
jgi:hypothetical protein